MANESNKNVIWTVVIGVILALILLGGLFVVNGNVNQANANAEKASADTKAMKDSVDNAINNIPSASEIASLVVVPAPVSSEGDTLYGGSSGSGDGDEASQLLQAAYPDESGYIEDDCSDALTDEFGPWNYLGDNVFYRIKRVIEARVGQRINPIDWSNVDYDYYGDYYFNVLNLGLGNQNARAGEFTETIRVEYTLEDGNQDDFKMKIYLIGTCSQWDKLDQRFDSVTLKVHA